MIDGPFGSLAIASFGLLSIAGFVFTGGVARRRLIAPLLILPTVSIFLLAWAAYFAVHPNGHEVRPDWVSVPSLVVPFALITTGIIFLWLLPRAWLFVGSYTILNYFFCSYASLIAAMAISGTWL